MPAAQLLHGSRAKWSRVCRGSRAKCRRHNCYTDHALNGRVCVADFALNAVQLPARGGVLCLCGLALFTIPRLRCTCFLPRDATRCADSRVRMACALDSAHLVAKQTFCLARCDSCGRETKEVLVSGHVTARLHALVQNVASVF